jgi:biopolymer transport protein TolR
MANMAFRNNRSSRYMSEINVTPMVDVMLVLLIVFMIGAPMLETGVDIDLPKTKNAKNIKIEQKPLIVAIAEDGSIFANDAKIGSLDTYLSRQDKERQILLKAHHKLDYGKVVDVMAAIRAQGFTKLGLVTQEK